MYSDNYRSYRRRHYRTFDLILSAKELKHLQQNMELVLIEASETLGGKIRTVQNGEFIMETGADSIVSRKTNVAPLLEELQLTDQVVYNATGTSFIYTTAGLKRIPDESVFGIPLSLKSLVESELVSAEGRWRRSRTITRRMKRIPRMILWGVP